MWSSKICLHVVQSASSSAVDALSLRSTNDDVGENSTVLKNKHGILLACFLLVLANLGCSMLLVKFFQVIMNEKAYGLARNASCHHHNCP